MTARRRPTPVHAGEEADGGRCLRESAAFWSRRAGRPLSSEDDREIAANLTGFFRVLAAWSEESGARSRPSPSPSAEHPLNEFYGGESHEDKNGRHGLEPGDRPEDNRTSQDEACSDLLPAARRVKAGST